MYAFPLNKELNSCSTCRFPGKDDGSFGGQTAPERDRQGLPGLLGQLVRKLGFQSSGASYEIDLLAAYFIPEVFQPYDCGKVCHVADEEFSLAV